MDYNKIIKKIYKLLIVYEKYDFEIYKSYLMALIQFLEGIDNPSDETFEALMRLKGIYKWNEAETQHTYIKDCVLDSCNKLQRENSKEV